MKNLRSNYQFWRKKRMWEKNWSRQDYVPRWAAANLPKEIQLAIEASEFPENASIVDIGCGEGELAFWLYEKGYRVLGFDWSQAAVDRAKKRFGEVPGKLSYERQDATQLPPRPEKFDILIDRGCFHGIPRGHGWAYARSIASWAKPGAQLWLYYRTGIPSRAKKSDTNAQARRAETEQFLTEMLSPYFDFQQVGDSSIGKVPILVVQAIRKKTD